MPSTWTVLGAEQHGGVGNLTVKSLPLPLNPKEILPNPEDVWIQISYSDVNPVDLQKLDVGFMFRYARE